MPMPETTKPICKTVTCKKELTYLKESGCWRCLICNPLPKEKPAPPKEKKPFLDVHITEARAREIVRDELENWHIQKPSVTKEEVKTYTDMDIPSTTINLETAGDIVEIKELTWRQQAKDLGISLMQPTGGVRKKADVLADIAVRKAG